MADLSKRKLQVFQTTIGFHDIVVAVPSRAAALRAFGTRRDMFAQGLAAPAEDAAAIEAALANPGTPLRRPAGTDKPYAADAASPAVADLGPRPKQKGSAPVTPPPPPDRTQLDAAEEELATLERQRDEERAALEETAKELDMEEQSLRARRHAFETERDGLAKAWQKAEAAAREKVARARRAYIKAGGKP